MGDVTGLQVSDILGLSEPLTKLIETVSTGMGMLYEPIHLKRRAKAKAEEIKLISDAIIANSNLPISYQHGNVGIDSSDIENLMRRMQQRVLQEEITKQQSFQQLSEELTKAQTESTQSYSKYIQLVQAMDIVDKSDTEKIKKLNDKSFEAFTAYTKANMEVDKLNLQIKQLQSEIFLEEILSE